MKASGSTGSRIAYDPIEINGAYHDGHLHSPAQTVGRAMETVRHKDGREEQVLTERLETVRSDRTVHTAVRSKAPRNTSVDQTVWHLGNVLIAIPPNSNRRATWRWSKEAEILQQNRRNFRNNRRGTSRSYSGVATNWLFGLVSIIAPPTPVLPIEVRRFRMNSGRSSEAPEFIHGGRWRNPCQIA